MDNLSVNGSRNVNYDLYFETDLLSLDNKRLLHGRDATSRNCLVVVDYEFNQIFGDKIAHYFECNVDDYLVLEMMAGEGRKNISSLFRVFDAMNDYPLNRRNEPVIIIGGGVVTDVASFATSCFRRGVPHIKVPTTLMGYVDAAIGIKNGINYEQYKNRMGSFYPPLMVALDKSFIASQSAREIANGVGEIIKIAVIKNRRLFSYLETYLVDLLACKFQSSGADYVLRQSITDMLEELEPNLYEDQLERLADFGHTFSLAFEIESAGRVQHGEAVAMDVLVSCQLACQRQLISSEVFKRVLVLLQTSGVEIDPSMFSAPLMWGSLCERVLHRNGAQHVPLPHTLGKGVFINDLRYEEISSACAATRLALTPQILIG